MVKPLINIAFCAYAPEFMDVRVLHPIQAFRAAGVRVGYMEKSIGVWSDCTDHDMKIAIVQRMLPRPEGWPKKLEAFINHGWLVIFDYDDYPKTPLMVQQGKWEKSLGWKSFELCHAVQTTTEPLAETFRQYNDNVGAFPNQLWQLPAHQTPVERPINLFFGAFNRGQSWRPIMESVNSVLAENPDVRVTVVGDRAFFDNLTCEAKNYHPAQSYQQYMALMAQADIALLPLKDDEFNRCKSDVKFLEASAARTAVIASPTVYGSTIIDGKTGLIADTAADWRRALSMLIDDKPLRRNLADAAYRYVAAQRMMMRHIETQLDWYRSLWNQREDLNHQLLARLKKV